MAKEIGNATLTASYATIGTAQIPSNWWQHLAAGRVAVRIKHVKHPSQSGGYPVVRVSTLTRNVANGTVVCYVPLNNGTFTPSAGVAPINAYTPEISVLALTDNDGTKEYPIELSIPPGHEQVRVEAKQAGDTTNFGTLTAELDGGP
jgi:hypothetical protein